MVGRPSVRGGLVEVEVELVRACEAERVGRRSAACE